MGISSKFPRIGKPLGPGGKGSDFILREDDHIFHATASPLANTTPSVIVEPVKKCGGIDGTSTSTWKYL